MATRQHRKPRTASRTVHIIGGGLAGMSTARALARHGFTARLLEAADHLGGKAGSVRNGDDWEDHGYHIFPAWYANTLALIDEIGCRKHLVPIRQTHTLRRGEFPRFVTSKEWTSLTNIVQNLLAPVLPFDEHLLAIYSAIDLAAEPFSERAYLDRVSATGFMRSRFYTTEDVAAYHHQTVLQSIAAPLHEVSAMTLRRTFRSWFQHPSPIFSILSGSLQERFIEPLQDDIERRGVEIQLRQPVKSLLLSAGRISAYELADGTRVGDPGDAFVLAVPHQRALELLAPQVLRSALTRAVERGWQSGADFGLGNLSQLRSAPIAAYHLRLRRRIAEIPAEHVSLFGSRFGISFIDIAPHWGLEHTTLNLIASNFAPLTGLADDEAKELLFAELREYVPEIRRDDLPKGLGFLQQHVAEPFFLNTVGAWASRPTAETAIDNLFLAGDFCRTGADLTSMEGAVMAGLSAAGAVAARAGTNIQIAPKPIDEPPWILLQALKYGMLPLIAPLGALRQVQRRVQSWF